MNLDFSLVLACGNVANEFEGKKKQKLTEIINTVKIHPAAGMLAFYHSIWAIAFKVITTFIDQ